MSSLRAFGDDDGGAAAAVASPSEEEGEEEEEEEAAAAAAPLVVVPPPPTAAEDQNENSKRRLGLFVASAALAHPDKAHYGGEDAWFCSPSSGTIGEFFFLKSHFFSVFFFSDYFCRRKKKNSRKTKTTKIKFTGIADGVGGWAESGICPAEYARELMSAARRAAEGFAVPKVTLESLAAARATPSSSSSSSSDAAAASGVPLACTDAAGGGAPAPYSASSSSSSYATPEAPSSPPSSSSYGEDGGASSLESLLPSAPSPSPSSPLPASEIPRRALAAAHAAVRLPGSATACVVSLDPSTGTLHGVSVGDSGALVVRGNFVLFRSRNSSHGFDCPRQLAAAPEHVEWSDGVEDGEAFEVEGLEEGMRFC